MLASLLLVIGVLIGASAARAEAPKIEFASPRPAAAHQESIEKKSVLLWQEWENRLAVKPALTTVHIAVKPPKEISGVLAGRTHGLNIELNSALQPEASESVLAHELAHAFLAAACPNAVPSEFYAESFALWLSRDDERLIASSAPVASKFNMAATARDYLQERLSSRAAILSFHEPEPAQALARLIAESRRLRATGDDSLLGHFTQALSSCQLSDDSLAVTLTGARLQSPLSKETVLIIDGLSGETLRERGAVERQQPVASLLKPYLMASRPAARVSVLSKKSAEWNCPVAKAGELWSWQKALSFSCNGFFLDHAPPDAEFWETWREPLQELGFLTPTAREMTLARAIGIVPGVEASARQLVALFRWLALKDRNVVEALLDTPRSGTLGRLPDSSWFVKHAIAMKSGTIRNEQNEPEHGWILAIGPRSPQGFPAFVAAIHQRGSSPQILLSRMRAHLEEVFGSHPLPPTMNQVQILSLAPRAALQARCEGPWLRWQKSSGPVNLTSPETVELLRMASGEARQCANGPIKIRIPKGTAFEERDYWGRLVISKRAGKSPEPSASARQNRARNGSELIIETSEANYLTGVLASEFPQGRAETLKALALVIKFNAANSRHGRRPVCDTTHCQVFGPRNGDHEARPGARLSSIVRELGRARIAGAREKWLTFALGGDEPWERIIKNAEIERRLKLPQPLFDISFADQDIVLALGGHGQGIVRRIPCEKFRNTLHLLSCPLEIAKTDTAWMFKGEGEGHGLGLDLKRADAMALEGRDYADILRAFFPGIKIEK